MSLLVYTSSVFALQRREEGSAVGAGQRVRRLQEKCSAQVVSEEDRGLPGNGFMTSEQNPPGIGCPAANVHLSYPPALGSGQVSLIWLPVELLSAYFDEM